MPLVAGPAGSGGIAVTYVAASASKAYAWALIASEDLAVRRWMDAGEAALQGAAVAELPLDATVEATAESPVAAGHRFRVPTGRRLAIDVLAPDAREGDVFVELFEQTGEGLELRRTVPARPGPAGRHSFVWHGLEDAELTLRVQPVLGYSGQIRIAAVEEPLLEFPVTGHGARSIQSGFGADRDGGRRAHRGVDIFASRGTEVVASLDGWVSRVDTTPRGGNVVWLQPLYGNLRLYYAHLDTQLVSDGDFVRAGDVLGTVGNTGNAITTPPHLHYGVYLRRRGMRGGARDPVDFLR